MVKNKKTAYLMLADGTIFEGYSLGATGSTIGEVVFNTNMVGYQETLTDPNYYGQIIVQTFPLIGNYGVNSYDGDKSYVKGYVIREWCEEPSNFRCEGTIDEFLKKQNIIAIYGIDTRKLTRKIRELGVMNGIITTEQITDKQVVLEQLKNYKIVDAVKNTSCGSTSDKVCEKPKYKVAVLDLGSKRSIPDKLASKGCNVTLLSYDITAQAIKDINPDGILLSDGPGDPAENQQIIQNVKQLLELNIPIFGIGLGHQILAISSGAKTYKLKHGHRGANQPVIDTKHGLTLITIQNHGFVVDSDSVCCENAEISHENANDKTCEGIIYKNKKAFSVQFDPQAWSGPLDEDYFFDKFIQLIERKD